MRKYLIAAGAAAGLFVSTTFAGASNYAATYSKVGMAYDVCVTNDPSSPEITNIQFGAFNTQPKPVAAPANWSFKTTFSTATGYSAEWDVLLGSPGIQAGQTLCGFEFSLHGKPLKGPEPVTLYTDGRIFLATTTATRS